MSYFFIGDGTEVLFCSAHRAECAKKLRELQAETTDTLSIYECDPTEIDVDDDAEFVWANPAEHAAAAAVYDLPSLREPGHRDLPGVDRGGEVTPKLFPHRADREPIAEALKALGQEIEAGQWAAAPEAAS